MHLQLFDFEYFDELRRRWLRGRYRAAKIDIAERYPQHRLLGEPEVREVNDDPAKRFPTAPS
jgi:hypothetical protein